MHLSVGTLIIGGGYAGLLAQKRLDQIHTSQDNFIIDQGDSPKFADKDYVIVFKNKNDFSEPDPINMYVFHFTSGTGVPFKREYAQKLYRKDIPIDLAFSEPEEEEPQIQEAYAINNAALTANARMYGNITVTSIDIEEHIVHAKVTHVNKPLTIEYEKLISTLPIYEFAKLAEINLLRDYGIFISFYPIGVIKKFAAERSDKIIMKYYSDPLIPFYRKHFYGNSIYYEYCINKPFDVQFNKIIGPGKFNAIEPGKMASFRGTMKEWDIQFTGRFALWDPDFRLDDVLTEVE